MEKCNTDTPLNRAEIRDSSEFWASIDHQQLLRGELEPAKTDEELEDRLGLGERALDFILKSVKKRHHKK